MMKFGREYKGKLKLDKRLAISFSDALWLRTSKSSFIVAQVTRNVQNIQKRVTKL